MFQNILIPVDGTTFGEHAVPWALAVAAPQSRLHLVHVHLPPAPMMVEGVVVADPTLDESMRSNEAGYLAELTQAVRQAAPHLTIESHNLETDDPVANTLAHAVKEIGADLVVMVTHARGPFARFWLGSVTDDFFRVSPVPVLLYRPPEGPVDFLQKPSVSKIVIPLDGSETAERILEPAIRLGQPFGADFALLLVLNAMSDAEAIVKIKVDSSGDPDPTRTAAQRAERYLERIADQLAKHNSRATCKLVREGAPSTVVLETAKSQPSTIIAITTHGRSGLTRLMMGSVTDEIIRGAVGPVLVYHPPVE